MLDLRTAAWPDVAATGGTHELLVVVPLGSCEQHGPHLPFDVDALVAATVAERACTFLPEGVLAPAMPYGASGEHEGYAGTLSVGTTALAAGLVELGRSATRWATRTLFVTGHGGNADALVAATTQLRGEGRDAAWWPCAVRGADAHAGRTETALMLALRPQAVRLDRAQAGCTTPLGDLLPALRAGGVAAVSPNGVLGDPAGASAEEGQALLGGLVAQLVAAAQAWQVGPAGRLGPA